MEFPRLVYKAADEHMLCEDQEHFDILLKEGYFYSVPEAIAGKHDTDDVLPPTRAELEQKAKELDIKFDGRFSDGKLNQLINDALGA